MGPFRDNKEFCLSLADLLGAENVQVDYLNSFSAFKNTLAHVFFLLDDVDGTNMHGK